MDALKVMNNALIGTGNNPISLNDGTPEWIVIETAFNRYVEELMSQHNWPFGRGSATLVATTPVPSGQWEYAVGPLPDDLLLLRSVFIDGVPTKDYGVYGRTLAISEGAGVTIEYISQDIADDDWHAQATKVLTLFLEAACYRGLNEDLNEARLRERDAYDALSSAKQIVGSENPAPPVHYREATSARRTRRA